MAEDYSAKSIKEQLPGNQPGKIKKVEEIKSSDYLPQYLNTTVNKKLLQSTLDQMISKASFETLDNWVGKIKGGHHNKDKDHMVGTSDTAKRFYNGSPGLVVKNPADTNSISEIYTYTDMLSDIDNLNYEGNRPNGSNFGYTYSPPIDYDKFVNYSNYYWCKDDLPVINVKPNTNFDPDDMLGQTRYKLTTSDIGDIDFLSGMKIKFAPEVTENFTSTSVNLSISGATGANPVVIQTSANHGLADGELINITGVVGMTQLNNNVYYIDVLTPNTFALYTDSGLTASVNGTTYTAYSSGGTAKTGGKFTLATTGYSLVVVLVGGTRKTVTTHYAINSTALTFTHGNFPDTGDIVEVLHFRMTNVNYYGNTYIVHNVGDSIELMQTQDENGKTILSRMMLYSVHQPSGFDMDPLDDKPYDYTEIENRRHEYVCMESNAMDANAWSRVNQWQHYNAIVESCRLTGEDFTTYASDSNRAKRPIIEFEKDIILYNYGGHPTVGQKYPYHKRNVDFITKRFTGTDIIGQTNYNFFTGVINWSNSTTYNQGDVVREAVGGSYWYFESKVAKNLDNDPLDADLVIDTANWKRVYDKGIQDNDTIMFLDTNNSTYDNRVFRVSGVGSAIALQQVLDPTYNDKVHTIMGPTYPENYNGPDLVYYDGEWTRPQQKESKGQAPKFDLFDSSNNEIATHYANNDFEGSTIFNYVINSAATEDTTLGFQAKYNSIAGASELVFEHPLVSKTYQYDLNTNPKDIKGLMYFAKRTTANDNTTTYTEGFLRAQNLDKTYYATETAVVTVDDANTATIPVGQNHIQKHADEFIFSYMQNKWTVFEKDQDTPKNYHGLVGFNPNVYLFAGTTVTIRKDYDSTETDLTFVKETDGTTSAPGITVTDNGATLSVAIDSNSANYDRVCKYKASGSGSGAMGKVYIVDEDTGYAGNAGSFIQFKHTVYKNGARTENYTLGAENVIVGDLDVGDVIELRYAPKGAKQTTSNWATGINFQHNPIGTVLGEHTHADLRRHFGDKISSLPGEHASVGGVSNYYVSSKQTDFGGTILQGNPAQNISQYIKENNRNTVLGIRNVMNDYDRFKNQLVNKAKQVSNTDTFTTTRELFNETMNQLNVGRNNTFRYATSGMCFFYNCKKQDITVSDTTVEFFLENTENYDYTTTNCEDHVYVYLKDYDASVSAYVEKMLMRDRDYTLDGNKLTLSSAVNLNANVPAVLSIDYYSKYGNSFVPWSACKLNFLKPVEPEINAGGTILTGHDGAQLTVTSTETDNLYRPQEVNYDVTTAILWELEKRVYAGFVQVRNYNDVKEFNPRHPGGYTHGQGTRTQWAKHYRAVFEYWLDSNNKAYPSLASGGAANYSNQTDADGVTLPGTQSGVIEYYCGTSDPLNNPWEMLGYRSRPTWWNSNYDWKDSANGGSDAKRAALLVALNKGMYTNPAGTERTDRKYVVKQNIGNLITVAGVLQDIVTAGWATAGVTTKDFVIGDGTVAEDEFKKTSAYNFALVEAGFRNAPHTFWQQFHDPSSVIPNNITNNKTESRPAVTDPVYGSPINKGTLDKITITNGGTGYSSSPTVTVTGDGIGGTAVAIVSGGVIKGIKITNGGYGYNNAGLTITDTTGSGAVTTVSVKKGSIYRTTGLLALIWLQNTSSQFTVDIHARNQLVTAQPIINVEGYTDKNIIRIRTLGNSNKAPFVLQDNDIDIALYKSSSKVKFNFSAIKITKLSGGYQVSGFEPDKKYFEYFSANQGSTSTIRFGSLVANIFNVWDHNATPNQINYDYVFPTINELANFVAGRTEWLISKGLQTFNFRGVVNSLLEWASTASLNSIYFAHGGNDLLFKDKLDRFCDSIFTTNKTVLVEDRTEISKTAESLLSNIKATRNTDGTRIYTDDGLAILRMTVDFVQWEHVIVLENKTTFNDIVHRPDIGMGFETYKLEGRRTINWTGDPSTQGYMVENTGLKANYDSSVREVEDDYFVIDSNALNKSKRNIAQTSIGYNKPDWAQELPISEDNSFDFYRSAIATKGTKENLKSLGRHAEVVDPVTDSFDINDQWLVKASDFAGNNRSHIELEFRDDLVIGNPQGVKLANDGNADSINDEIITLQQDDKRLVTKLTSPNQFTLGNNYYYQTDSTFTEFDDWLKNAGYPLMSEVDEQALTIDDISTLYDETKDYATILAWDNTTSYKLGDKVRYQEYVYQCNVDATGFDTTRNPITWNGTVNNPVLLPGGTLVIDSNTINLTNPVTTVTYNAIDVTSNASPVVNGGDTLILDGITITFAKSSTTTTYPDFAVAGSTVNPSIVGSATKTLIINGTTVTFNDTEAITVNRDWNYCVGDQMTSATVSSVTAADRITAWTNLRNSLQSVYGNASTRTKLDTYLNASEAGFDTSVLVTEHGATGNATLQGHILAFLTQDVTIINEKAGTSYVTADVLSGSTPVNGADETTTQNAFNLSTYTDDIHVWLTASANDSTAISGTIIVMSEADTQFKTYSATEIVNKITSAGITNVTASLVSNQLTITRGGRTASDKDLTIGAGTGNAEVDNAGTTFPSSGTLTHTGSDNTTTSTTAALTVAEVVQQINDAGITNVGAVVQDTNKVKVSKTTSSSDPNLTVAGTAVADLSGGFTTGTLTATTTTSTSQASLSVGLVAQKINDAGITGISASVVNNRIVIKSTNASGIMNNTQAALDLGINSNILGVTRNATTSQSSNTFDASEWTVIGEPLLEYIWVADDTKLGYTSVNANITGKFNGWNVFKVMDPQLYASKICAAATTSTGNDAEVSCNKAHNLQKGDIVLLLNTNSKPAISGFHTVTGTDTASDAKFFIDEFIDQDASYAKVLVLRPVRFTTDAQRDLALSTSSHYTFAESDRIWVDGTTQFKVYKKDAGASWIVQRTQGDNHVSPTTIQSSILHDQVSVLEEAEAYDPFKGVIPGLADKEIDYKTINDPAIYTNSTDSTAQINQQQAWGSNYLGSVWWDTNKAIYIDYEQDSVEYRTQYWGTLFKGASIDVYEWTRSDVAPDQYAESVTAGKVINGLALTGEAYKETDSFGNDLYYYTEVDEFDPVINGNVTFYYFWVKNKTTVPLGTDRTSSVLNLASMINNPTAQDIRWLNATGKDSFIVSNLRNHTSEKTVLQITNISNEDNQHTHWTPIIENDTAIPEYFHRRLKDSLRGSNENKKEKTYKAEWLDTSTYADGQVVSIDAPVPTIKIAKATKATTQRFYNRGDTSTFTINGSQTDDGQILTLQRGKTYLFDQNDSTNDTPIVFSPTFDAYIYNKPHYFAVSDGVTYYLDGIATSLTAYQTAIGTPSNTQDKKVQLTITDATPNTLWYGGNGSNVACGSHMHIINEEKDESPAYYMSLIDSNTNIQPQTNRMAWRRVYNVVDIDDINETIQIPEEKMVPDLNLHPLDRVGDSIRPSRSWFEYKNISRREVVNQLNNLLINTNLVDKCPEYKTYLDVTVSVGSKDYNVADYWENVDWFDADRFDKFVIPNRTVTEITPLLTSGDANQLSGQYDGEYVLAKDVLHTDGIKRDSIYRYENSTGKWEPVWKENGTIQLDDRLWDPIDGAYGLDSAGFDNAGFDSDPIHEFTKIMDCFRDNILSQADYNKIWFAGIYDAVKEMPNSEWIKKSTYIVPRLSKQVNTTGRIGYDAVNIIEQYIDKNKPFTSKYKVNPSLFQDQKTVLDKGSAIITEHSRNMAITEKVEQHTDNQFSERLGGTAVVAHAPLPFDDVDIVKTFNSVDHTVRRNPIITSWQHSSGNVVAPANTISENEHLVNVPADVEKVSWHDDYVYVRTSGITDASGGPTNTVAPDTEGLVTDQRPTSATQFNWKIPRTPKAASAWPLRGDGPIGVFTNGVAIFSPRDFEPTSTGSIYYRNEAYLRRNSMDANNGTSWSSKGNYEPTVKGLYYHYNIPNEYASQELATKHSPIIGWALDGYPIYGPYGFANTDGTGAITKMTSSWVLKSGARTGLGAPTGNYDGSYTADYQFNGSGILDRHNGRFAVTPEFPDGVYHYHATPDAYPYLIGDEFYGEKNGSTIYDGTTTIDPWLPHQTKAHDSHDITANGGTFTNVDADYTFFWDGQGFLNQYEIHGNAQYKVDFNEALQIAVQTNPQGIVTAGATYSVNAQEANPRGITFNTDGTKMFIVGTSGDDVNEYTLSTGFDLTSTVTFVTSFSVSAQESGPTAVKFNTDGTKMFITGVGSSNVHEYALTTGFDVSTASFTQTLVTTVDTDNFGLDFKDDGTKMYITGNQNDKIYEYNLSSAFDISTATFNQDLSTQPHDYEPFGIEWSPDGTRLFIVGTIHNGVDLWYVSTPWDISTATHQEFYFVGGNPSGIHISPDGTKMFVTGNNSDLVKSYTLSVPYEFTISGTATADTRSFIYFQDDDNNVYSSVIQNTAKDTLNGALTASATEITVADATKFYDPNFMNLGKYIGPHGSTAQAKYGTQSMTFDATSDRELFTPSTSTMVNGEIHFFIYMDNTATDARILTSAAWGLRRSAAGTLDFIDSSGATLGSAGLTGINDAAWHHVSIQCNGTDLTVSLDGGATQTVATTQFTTSAGIEFGNTSRLTGTYSGNAAIGVWIDCVQIKSAAANTAPPGSAVVGELVSENFEPMNIGIFEIEDGIVTIGTERVHYGAIDTSANKLLFCTRGAEGTSAVAHLNSATVIDCSPTLRIPALRQIHLYGDGLTTAYNDPSTSLASGTGVSVETQFIRSASQGEYF